jgi:HAD superfamily hydrolase (TIGR01450 family)
MKAVILAAGIGSRLRPITNYKPKCLVKVAGKPILEYQLRAYANAGIEQIIIIAGYKFNAVREYCSKVDYCNIKIIENPKYDITNNMYSLYLAREEVDTKPFMLSNGDVALDAQMVAGLVQSESDDLIATEIGSYNEESMKIALNSHDYITDISKTISTENAYGLSADIYKFSAFSSKVLFTEIRKIIEAEKNVNEWTEVALQRLFKNQALKMQPFGISSEDWLEVDNFNDLVLADSKFADFKKSCNSKRVYLIDLDGTTYIGNRLIPGAEKFIESLKTRGIPFYFMSNNSSRSKKDYVKKLHDLGIDVDEENFILSTDGLVNYLAEQKVKDVFLVGTQSLENSLHIAGINTNSENPQYVVLGYDTELTYEKLKTAALHMNRGVKLLATHCDVVCPTPQGPIPDIGSMLALFEKATNTKPEKIFGKPSPEMVKHILIKHDVQPKEVVIIGDRLYTDMAMAQNIGADFILVLSGETSRENVEGCDKFPNLIVPDMGYISL